MLSERLQQAINEQIGKEFYSGYLYLSMAAYFEDLTLNGFAHWMRVQGQEESCHAMIFYNYMAEQGARVRLPAIDQPQSDFKSPLDVFETGLAHERTVTQSINNLMDIAIEDRDHASHSFLNWFVDEQVEEESTFDTLRSKLKLVGGESHGLFMLDQEVGARVFNMPAQLLNKI